jgi:regulator of protease activity HflC (stomatin/prohibitin superfamily)
VEPYLASYGVENPVFAVIQLAQTTMRSELGKITLDKTFEERDTLNCNIVKAINEAATDWGLKCLRYEISKRAAFFLASLFSTWWYQIKSHHH